MSKFSLKRPAIRLLAAILRFTPIRLFPFLARMLWHCSWLLQPSAYWLGLSRQEIGRQSLGLSPGQCAGAEIGYHLEKLLDWKMATARPEERNWPGLEETARRLSQEIQKLRQLHPASPVILSPFHYVSQYTNIQVCDLVRQYLGLEKLSVVSAVPYGVHWDDHSLIPHLRILYTYADQARNSLGISFVRALKKEGVAVLFADITPWTLARAPMETTGVSLFGKPARIQNGVFRLGAPLQAILLPFALQVRDGRCSAQIHPALSLADPEAPRQLAACIEHSIRSNYPQWLQAGHPAMYWFASAR